MDKCVKRCPAGAGSAGLVVMVALAMLFSGMVLVNNAQAGTLENLERERALVIKTMIDPELTAVERFKKLEASKARLIDLERLVLRDKNLKGRNTPAIRRAFENYDLTFMVHAAAENNLTLLDNWLSQLGLSTHAIMSSKIRRR